MTDIIEYLLNLLGALFVTALCLEFGFSRFQKRKFPNLYSIREPEQSWIYQSEMNFSFFSSLYFFVRKSKIAYFATNLMNMAWRGEKYHSQ